MTHELIACCPECGWDNDGKVSAIVAFDYGAPVDALRLFADGFDADVDDETGNAVLCDLRECPECEHDTDSVAEWVGAHVIRCYGLRPVSESARESEAEGLDAIAREEVETLDGVSA